MLMYVYIYIYVYICVYIFICFAYIIYKLVEIPSSFLELNQDPLTNDFEKTNNL